MPGKAAAHLLWDAQIFVILKGRSRCEGEGVALEQENKGAEEGRRNSALRKGGEGTKEARKEGKRAGGREGRREEEGTGGWLQE